MENRSQDLQVTLAEIEVSLLRGESEAAKKKEKGSGIKRLIYQSKKTHQEFLSLSYK